MGVVGVPFKVRRRRSAAPGVESKRRRGRVAAATWRRRDPFTNRYPAWTPNRGPNDNESAEDRFPRTLCNGFNQTVLVTDADHDANPPRELVRGECFGVLTSWDHAFVVTAAATGQFLARHIVGRVPIRPCEGEPTAPPALRGAAAIRVDVARRFADPSAIRDADPAEPCSTTCPATWPTAGPATWREKVDGLAWSDEVVAPRVTRRTTTRLRGAYDALPYGSS